MASKKVEKKKKVLRFGFKIHDAVDYEIDKKTPEIIDSISSASLVKALELVVRQHCGCNGSPFATANRRFQYGYDIMYKGNLPIVQSIRFGISILNCKSNKMFSFGLILNVRGE